MHCHLRSLSSQSFVTLVTRIILRFNQFQSGTIPHLHLTKLVSTAITSGRRSAPRHQISVYVWMFRLKCVTVKPILCVIRATVVSMWWKRSGIGNSGKHTSRVMRCRCHLRRKERTRRHHTSTTCCKVMGLKKIFPLISTVKRILCVIHSSYSREHVVKT